MLTLYHFWKRDQKLSAKLQYEAPKPSDEIMAEILELEKELSGSLEEVFR